MRKNAPLPLVLHIPHASSHIPASAREQFVISDNHLWREVLRLTDWYTDELFGACETNHITPKVNRLVVDLERFEKDSEEVMARVGQGVIYSHDCDYQPIRKTLTSTERTALLDQHYYPCHKALTETVTATIDEYGHCLLVDCHSFPSAPFPYELPNDKPRPDICIGTDETHTPPELVDFATQYFKKHGLSVALNYPYQGCILPNELAGQPSLSALMIEINRALYMEEPLTTYDSIDVNDDRLESPPEKLPQFVKLQSLIQNLLIELATLNDPTRKAQQKF
jgi:N-formylglutamate amidohydrolase